VFANQSLSMAPLLLREECDVRRVAICVTILTVSSGCAISRLWEPSRDTVIEQILPSSVQIVLERDGHRFRAGSGVTIAAHPSARGTDCFVLTSGHALSRRSAHDQVFVLFGRHHGAGTKASATVLAYRETEDLDLALLRTRTNECFPVEFGRPPRLGDSILVVAYPWGRNMTLVGGIVSQVNVDEPSNSDTAPRLIVDASVSYGSSGGGVYDERTGRLVGLVEGYRTARVSFDGDGSPQHIDVPVPGETYLVPLADIRRFLIQTDQQDLLGNLRSMAPIRP
jgi:serine protease Do